MRTAARWLPLTCTIVLAVSAAPSDTEAQAGPNARQVRVLDRLGRPIHTTIAPDAYSQPAFSPDGSHLALVKTDPETRNQDIWVVSIGASSSRRVTTGRVPASLPAWSPDGRHIAFVSNRPPDGWVILRVAADGQSDEEVLYRHTGFGGISSLEWSSGGEALYFSDLLNISGALYRLPLALPRRAIEILRPPVTAPRISPDGHLVAYQSFHSGRSEIYLKGLTEPSQAAGTPAIEQRVSTAGGIGMIAWHGNAELTYLASDLWLMAIPVRRGPKTTVGGARRLFKAPPTIRSPGTPGPNGLTAVSRDGERFAFAVPQPPSLQRIALLDRDGTTVLTRGGPGLYAQPTFSPDERQVAFVRTDPESGQLDVHILNLVTQKARALTSDRAIDAAPVWSPDGKHVAYVSTRGDHTGIYRRRADGTGSESAIYQHTPGTPSVVLTDWSQDGRFMVFHAGDVLYLLPLDDARHPIELIRDEFSNVGGRFSPDGRFLAYLSDRTGRYEAYVRSATAGENSTPLQISDDGAQGMIFWRRDGAEIGYLSRSGLVRAAQLPSALPSVAPEPFTLFRAPIPTGAVYGVTGNSAQLHNVSPAADRFAFAVSAASQTR